MEWMLSSICLTTNILFNYKYLRQEVNSLALGELKPLFNLSTILDSK